MLIAVKTFFALLVVIGTALQMRLALLELRESRKDSLAWLRAEDQLVAEQGDMRRRRNARRELRVERTPLVKQDLRQMKQAVVSWALLTGAAAGALWGAVTGAI